MNKQLKRLTLLCCLLVLAHHVLSAPLSIQSYNMNGSSYMFDNKAYFTLPDGNVLLIEENSNVPQRVVIERTNEAPGYRIVTDNPDAVSVRQLNEQERAEFDAKVTQFRQNMNQMQRDMNERMNRMQAEMQERINRMQGDFQRRFGG